MDVVAVSGVVIKQYNNILLELRSLYIFGTKLLLLYEFK